MAATLEAITHLGYIQIDTISVVARAHHHTLWNRNRRYQPDHLDRLVAQRRVYEYWSHAAAYLPMKDYRFSLPRMHAYASGQRHWYQPDRRLMRKVMDRIKLEGPLQARDFEHDSKGAKKEMWDWKPAKQALEQLFMEGKLMTSYRQGFQKVYDLTERVLPSDVDTRVPSQSEYARFLITRFRAANGLGQASEIGYLRKGLKSTIENCMAEMEEAGEIVSVTIRDRTYFLLPVSLDLLERQLPRKRLKILSPFDNLVIQRKRMQHLFDFDYQIECYVPAEKRKHGYFSLPVLWDGRLVARVDCKADRQTGTLMVRNLVIEPSLRKIDALIEALAQELWHFAEFNRCDNVSVEHLPEKSLRSMLVGSLNR